MSKAEIVNRFKYIQPDQSNIDDIVATNRRMWYYKNSDAKTPDDINDIEIENGILKSEITHSNIKDGFQLSVEEFIEDEITELEKVDLSELSFGEKKKHKIYLEFLKRKLTNSFFNQKSSYNYIVGEQYKLSEYRKAIWSGYFKDLIKEDRKQKFTELHYPNIIKSWLEQRNQQVDDNPFLKERKDLLKGFNRTLSSLLGELMDFFTVVHNFDYNETSAQFNEFNFKMFDVEMSLKSIEEFAQIFNHNINTGHYKTALHVQHYCLLMFDNIISILDDRFFVRIYNSPMSEDFSRTRLSLKTAIDLDKLQLMVNIKDDVIHDRAKASKILSSANFLEFNTPIKKQTHASLKYDDEANP